MEIDGKTQLIGLIGWPISHTKSPTIHNAVIADEQKNLVYLPLPVRPDAIEDAIRGLPVLGFLGINVTVPHKEAVFPFLDEIDQAARAIGAVNTIHFLPPSTEDSSTKSIGYNTDWIGFRDDLVENGVGIEGRDCFVFGAGGSARAVVYALLSEGGVVYLWARRHEQALQLQREMLSLFPNSHIEAVEADNLEESLAGLTAPLIVNTTPVGMVPNVGRSVWPAPLPFPSGSYVYDLVYNPAETALMKEAKSQGCQTQNGMGMLLRQAAHAFFIWTGLKPKLEVMHRALKGRK